MTGVQLFALICVGCYMLMSAGVGTRLLIRAWPTRSVPELLMGFAYLAAPGCGYPLVIVGGALETATGLVMLAVGQALITIGVTAFMMFNARVFRPNSTLAQGAAMIGGILFAISQTEIVRGHMALGARAIEIQSVRQAAMTLLLVLGMTYAWTAYEGFRHNGMMRRRERVGLGDPVVANRFLLWAIAGSLQVVSAVIDIHALWTGGDYTRDIAPVLGTSLVGVFNSFLLVLIFLPPVRYTRWLQREPKGPLPAPV